MLFTRGGGKAAANSWSISSSSIGLLSYLDVQVYQPAFGRTFRAIHSKRAALQAFSWGHIFSDEFLCKLPGQPIFSADRRMVELGHDDFAAFEAVAKNKLGIQAVVKKLKSARRKGGADAEGSDEE